MFFSNGGIRYFRCLQFFPFLLLVACSGSGQTSQEHTLLQAIQLEEEVKFLDGNRTLSTRCAGYDRLGGRNQGVLEAQSLAKADAISANSSLVKSRFLQVTKCSDVNMKGKCSKELEDLTQVVSKGFLNKAEKKIVDYAPNIVCVTLIGVVDIPDDLIDKSVQQLAVKQKVVEAPKKVAIKKDKMITNSSTTIRNPAAKKLPEPIIRTAQIPVSEFKPAITAVKVEPVKTITKRQGNLLKNGDFKQKSLSGWTLIDDGGKKGIKRVKLTEQGLLISFKGKGKHDTQFAISQLIDVDITKPLVFESNFSTIDDIDANEFPAIKLQFVDSEDNVIIENVWTADEYYSSENKFVRNSISLGRQQRVRFATESFLRDELEESKVNQITGLKLIYDVSAPSGERCLICRLNIHKSSIKYL